MPIDLTPPAFDPDEHITHLFSDNGDVDLGILDHEGNLATSFRPAHAREIGVRLIQLSFEITTTIARENGLTGAAPLRDIILNAGVDYSDEVYHAAKNRAEKDDNA